MEALYTAGQVSLLDLNRIYGGAFVAFHSYLENSLEDLFLGLVTQRLEIRGVRPLVSISGDRVAQRVVFGGRNYADWLPFNKQTVPRAEAFLSSGRPFTELSKADRNFLDDLALLRNALAHESGHSMKQFRRVYVGNRALPPQQTRPAGYLRGQHTLNQRRFEYLLGQAAHIVGTLCS